MKIGFVLLILLLALIGFALQPTKGKAVPVTLAPLRTVPLTLGNFQAIARNDDTLSGNPSTTDGSVGLDRTYVDNTGRSFEMIIVPQTIGQHVPLLCDRYGGYTILSETQSELPDRPVIRFNRLRVRGTSDHVTSTCVYYWKTADGVFVSSPGRSLGMIAARWSEHQQALFVNICSTAQSIQTPSADHSFDPLVASSYDQVKRLYPQVFRNPTKD